VNNSKWEEMLKQLSKKKADFLRKTAGVIKFPPQYFEKEKSLKNKIELRRAIILGEDNPKKREELINAHFDGLFNFIKKELEREWDK